NFPTSSKMGIRKKIKWRLVLVMLLANTASQLNAQELTIEQRSSVDSLIQVGAFYNAERIIDDWRLSYIEGSIDNLWLLSRRIEINESLGNFDESVRLMRSFIQNEFAVNSYDKNASVASYSQDSIPFGLIQWLMPEYYRKIVDHCIQKGMYEEGLQYLQKQRENYPFNPPCTVGIIGEKDMEFIIFSSRLHFHLENYDTVLNLLLPLNFESTYRVFRKEETKTELDSILYSALRMKYTDSEILNELNYSIEDAIERKITFAIFEPFTLNMFGRDINGIVNRGWVIRTEGKIRSNSQNLDVATVEELVSKMHQRFISDTVRNMRIYKYIEEKN
ncbi:MAG: hypothetical protein ACRBG0_28180, partial [Lewinella sp.]|uniref:hypothetical protein n=1 Tax=Lewinella sp. TaxID=2004506 RepID=UPI003D6AD627